MKFNERGDPRAYTPIVAGGRGARRIEEGVKMAPEGGVVINARVGTTKIMQYCIVLPRRLGMKVRTMTASHDGGRGWFEAQKRGRVSSISNS